MKQINTSGSDSAFVQRRFITLMNRETAQNDQKAFRVKSRISDSAVQTNKREWIASTDKTDVMAMEVCAGQRRKRRICISSNELRRRTWHVYRATHPSASGSEAILCHLRSHFWARATYCFFRTLTEKSTWRQCFFSRRTVVDVTVVSAEIATARKCF